MLPGRRADNGSIFVVQGPAPAGALMEGGVAVTPLGAIYISELATSFSPIDLFQNNEQGAWYDPSDLSTMFQDSAGTTPVTADGQTVGKILDKSGRGNHATAPSDAARPLYKTDGTYHWLQFDGVDDSLTIGAPGVPILGDLSIFYGVLRATASAGRIVNQLQGPAQYNSYEMGWNPNSNPNISQDWYQSAENGGSGFSSPPTTWPVTAQVFTATRNANVIQFRRNAVNDGSASSALTQPIAGGVVTFSIGRRQDGYAPVNGNIYSLIVRGALSTTQEITDTETWINSKTGAY